MCRINPRVDFAFKKLFGSEENNDLLPALVNAILEPEIKIAELTVKNPYNLADYKAGKLSILDIKAKDDGGRWYNIEMQVNEDAHYDKRAIFYWAKLVTEQLTEGRMYAELKSTISINILDFLYTPGERFHSRYGILNRETCEDDRLHGVFDLHYLELRKFHKRFDELTTALDRWATFLSRAHELDKRALPSGMTGDPYIQKAVEAVDRMLRSGDTALRCHPCVKRSALRVSKWARWGCEIAFRFPCVKLIDWQTRWAELEAKAHRALASAKVLSNETFA
jgi:predicted transposase/invertase (TIGR01784 family)